jgi:hypothetical protein
VTQETYSGYGARKGYRNWRISSGHRHAKDFGFVEKIFWCYNQIVRAVEEIRAEQSYYKASAPTGGAGTNHAFISDPTSQLAIQHAEKIRRVIINPGSSWESSIDYPEDWIVVVHETLKHFQSDELEHIVLLHRYIKDEPMATTCIDLEITKERYYDARDAGINFARECAIQLGLIKVF